MDTVLKTDRCFYCAKYTRRCYPIKYTDAGELPETLPAKRHRQNKLKEQIWEPRAPKDTRLSRCHGCYVNCLRCIFTDPGACDACAKKNTTCRSIELNEAGELPETRYHRERRVARGESLTRRYRPTELQEQELLSISMSRMQILSSLLHHRSRLAKISTHPPWKICLSIGKKSKRLGSMRVDGVTFSFGPLAHSTS
jgi:hypothetical protein